MATEVTDPELLALLNGGGKPVTDPALLAQLNGSPSAADYAADIAKSAGIGLARGAIGLAGLPGDVKALVGAGVDSADSFVRNQLGMQPRAQGGPQPPNIMPSSATIQGAVEGVTGDFYKPQTTAGEYAKTAGEFVPGAMLAPGNMALNAARYGVVPGLASEAAGQATKGTAYEPYARVGAGVATGVGAAMLSRPAYSERLVGRAAQGVDDAQYAAAEQLMRDAQARGIQLTPAEAIQQVTGGGTRLGDVQRLTESTQGGVGSDRLNQMFAQRPGQMRQAADAAFDQIAPRSATPSHIGREAQEAATGAIDHTRQTINRLAEPFYNAAENVPIPPAEHARLMQLPGYQDALRTVRDTPQLNRYVAHLPDESVGVLNEVKKQLNQAGDNVAAAVNPNRNVQASAGYRMDARDVTDSGRMLSPDYGAALGVEEAGRRQVLSPLQSGPAGAISQTDDIAAQGRAVINNVNSPREVTRALQNMGRQNPNAARGVVREELGRAADKTVGGLDNAGRPDQFGGAKLARTLRGDARQAQNVDAAIRAVSGPPVADDIAGLADALQATGYRQRPGSLTAFNAEAIADMKRGGIGGVAQSVAKPLSAVKESVQRMRLGSQSERLAELLLSGPDGVRRIQELAARGNDQAAVMARALLSYQAGSQPR